MTSLTPLMDLLELKKISKSFGVVNALSSVDFTLGTGEIHALIGENGAGKSTLMKILSGVYQADTGTITFRGNNYQPKGPAAARRAGVAMIYQELNLAPHLTVAENIALGLEKSFFGLRRIDNAKIKFCLQCLGHEDLSPSRLVSSLSIGLCQVVEIARALYSDAKVVIMDEPTSSLSGTDTQALFEVIGRLKASGVSVVYISHFLEEVKEVADSFTVLRDGSSVAKGQVSETSISKMVENMVGRSVDELFPRIPREIGETVLEVKDIRGERIPKEVSFSLRRGEILGIAGLVGSGRTETLRCLFGLDKSVNSQLKIKSKVINSKSSPSKSLFLGMDMLSENRKEEGLATSLPISNNLTLSALRKYRKFGFLNLRSEKSSAKEWCEKLNVKLRSVKQTIDELSGGNQQKIAIARLLHHDSEILLLDEPTRGIDVGSKAEIYQMMMKLASQGKAIIFVSSYLPELLGVCDSLAVAHRGYLSPVRPVSEWSEKRIMIYASSGRNCQK